MIPSPTMIAGGAAVVAFMLVGLQTWRLGNAQEEIGALAVKVDFQIAQTQEAVGVNETLNTNIDELAEKIANMIEARRLERDEQDALLAARQVDLDAARTLALQLQGERDDVFRNDLGCETMGKVLVNHMCPVIAVQLRERSADRRSSDGGPPS